MPTRQLSTKKSLNLAVTKASVAALEALLKK
jgi:hypothetical protein